MKQIEVYKKIPKIISILIGGAIGFISGVVGIGGGIFLRKSFKKLLITLTF